MDTDREALIIRYHRHQLSDAERLEVERLRADDPLFDQAVTDYGLAWEAVRLEANTRLRERLAQKGKELDAENPRRPKPRIGKIGMAALVIGAMAIGIAGIWLSNRYGRPNQAPSAVPAETEQDLPQPEQMLPPSVAPDPIEAPVVEASVSAEDLFAAWFKPYRDDSIEPARRGEGEGELTPEETFYQRYWDARYAAALAAFERLEPDSKAKGDLRFLKANCLLVEKKTALAISILESPGRTRFDEEARWLLALAYVRAGKQAKAAALLRSIAGDAASPKREQARELLSEVE